MRTKDSRQAFRFVDWTRLFDGPIHRVFCVYLIVIPRSFPSFESTPIMKIVACYIRVSMVENDQAKQRRQINHWLKSNRLSSKTVRWYVDKSTKKELRQPQLESLQADVLDGQVRAVVVWHFDRLSLATRKGLKVLIDWCEHSLRIVSVSQQIDIKSKDCGMIASVLSGVAE